MNHRHLMFIRHGETQANQQQLAYGVTESPLNEKGIGQAQATGKRLTAWPTTYDRILSSPLSRALETAKWVNAGLDLPLEIEPGLIESDLGDWEGITYQQMHDYGYAVKSIKDDAFEGHGGESPNTVYARVEAALTKTLSRYPNENIICVSHGSAIAHGMAWLMKTRPKFGYQYLMHNGAITEVRLDPEPSVLTLNDYGHLDEVLQAPLGQPANAQQA
ncbi:MAG: histidine phosphatase family protein [Candidatus Azotimanducaceae bacterium]